MSGLTRDGTAEPNARDQIPAHEKRLEKFVFPVQLTTSRVGNYTRLIPSLLKTTITTHTHQKISSR